MGFLVGSSPFFRPGPPARIGEGSKSVLDFLYQNVEGKVLDLGGGQGAYALELLKKGMDVTLGEIDLQCITSASALGLKTIDTNKVSLHEIEGKFDTVVLLEVLEHVTEYQEFLNNALACAKVKLILTVPCNDDFEEIFRANLTYNHIAVSDHVNQFTSGDLNLLLEKTGFNYSLTKGDFLLGGSIIPLVYNKLKRHPLGIFLAIPLKIFCRMGWVPDLFPSRFFVVISKTSNSKAKSF
jgi:hypothetical protein